MRDGHEHTAGPWRLVELTEASGDGPALVELRRGEELFPVLARDSLPELMVVLMSYLGVARVDLEMTG